jgi:hypothetical protein
MSHLGHSRPNLPIRAMSAIALIATKLRTSPVIRFVPQADMAGS